MRQKRNTYSLKKIIQSYLFLWGKNMWTFVFNNWGAHLEQEELMFNSWKSYKTISKKTGLYQFTIR